MRGSILSWYVSPPYGGVMVKAPEKSDLLRLLTYSDRICAPMPEIYEVIEAFRARVPDRELLIQEGYLRKRYATSDSFLNPNFSVTGTASKTHTSGLATTDSAMWPRSWRTFLTTAWLGSQREIGRRFGLSPSPV
jgi:hypothetical protein